MQEEKIPSFEEIACQLSQPLYNYIKSMLGNAADADDLLQETLIRISANLSKFEGKSSVKNWAYKIASNVTIDFFRKHKNKHFVEFTDIDEPADFDDNDRLVITEMNDCIRRVIDELPPDYRTATVLFNLQGKSIAEIAEICDISVSTAKIRIHRAKLRLKEALGKKCTFYQSPDGNLRCDEKQ